MKKSFVHGVLCGLAGLLLGCVSARPEKPLQTSPVYITNSKKWHLLSPENIEKNVDGLQFFSGTFGEKQLSLQVYVKADKNEIFLSLMNDFGACMGTIFFDAQGVRFDSAVFPDNIRLEYIIADLQFAYYTEDSIRSALQKTGLDFVVETEGDREIRKIMNRKKCIMEIKKAHTAQYASIRIENFLRGYTYNLQEVRD